MKERILLIFTVLILLTCQKYENPFEVIGNSYVYVLKESTTFNVDMTDTAYLFTSETLAVTTTVPELLDSFVISVTANRFFPSKTIKKPTAGNYFFIISQYNTGRQTITIQTYKQRGITETRHIFLYVKNQLNQTPLLNLNINDSIELQTQPVGDQENRHYNWIFEYQTISSLSPSHKVKLYQMGSTERTGYLYVSDLRFSSPKVSFKYSFVDTIRPSIICINDNFTPSTKTISTPDSTALLRVHVTDGDNISVKSVMFKQITSNGTTSNDGQKADFSQGNFYSKLVNNMYQFTEDNPFRMEVRAVDHFDNVQYDTFSIVFNPNTLRNDITNITIKNIEKDTIVTSVRTIVLSGTVTNTAGRPVFLQIHLNDEEKLNQLYATGEGGWSTPFTLNNDINTFSVVGKNSENVTVAQRNLIITFSPEIDDTKPPLISKVKINGIEGKLHYVDSDSASLYFEANDLQSGIYTVTIDDTDLSVTTGQNSWETPIRDLNHGSNTVKLLVKDNKRNISTDSVMLFYNRLPSAELPDLAYAIRTDSIYTAEINVADPDFDTVRILRLHQPAGMQFSKDNRIITWTVNKSDAGMDSLVFRLSDDHQETEYYRQYYNVYNPASINETIRLFDDQAIPSFLQAQRDTLNFVIRLNEQTGTPPYLYRTQIKTPRRTFDTTSSDSSVLWAPLLGDTGQVQITIQVADNLRQSDTLLTTLLVVPPNADSAKLKLRSIVNADTIYGGIIRINSLTKNVLLEIEILDTDHPLTEDHVVSVVMNGSVRFYTDSSIISITISPTQISSIDTITVTVNDKTSAVTDTLRLPVFLAIRSPDSIAGLERWYKAGNYTSDFNTTTWFNYNPFRYTISSPFPQTMVPGGLNGQTTIRLKGSYLQDQTDINWSTNSFSIFIVAKYDLQTDEYQALISTQNGNKSLSFGISKDNSVSTFINYPNASVSRTSIPVASQSWYIYSFRSDGIMNKKMNVIASANLSFDTLTLSDLSMYGGMKFGTTYHDIFSKWYGEFAEIIVYHQKLTDLECRGVIGYLTQKFGIK